MSFENKISSIKKKFADKFDKLSLRIEKSEMIDPVNDLRCERMAVEPDFGISPFFKNDMLNPCEDGEFSQDSLFIYCHDNKDILREAEKRDAIKMPDEILSIGNDIRTALAFLSSDKKSSDDEAALQCENIAKPVSDISDKHLDAAFNLILRSGLSKSVKANSECLEKTWFTSENGFVPGSMSLARMVAAYRSWNSLRAASRKDELIKTLSSALEDFNHYVSEHERTKGGMTIFLEKTRDNFKKIYGVSKAKDFCYIKWEDNNKTSFLKKKQRRGDTYNDPA